MSDKKNRMMKSARARLGMTQRDLSDASGISEAMIARFETTRSEPSPEEKKKLASVLGVPTFELFGNGGAR